jgi:hypothetical protein
VRSFRFQWPADLLTSWAFEMEALILGWYVLVTTARCSSSPRRRARLARLAVLAVLRAGRRPHRAIRNVLCFTRAV